MPSHCTACGTQVAPEAAFCHKCGAALAKAAFGAPAASTGPAKARIQAGAATSGVAPTPVASAVPGTEPESELWVGSYSWKHMIGSWLLAAVVTIGLLVGAFFLARVQQLANSQGIIWGVAGGLSLLIWVYLLLLLLYRQLSISYRLTTELLTIQRGIFNMTHDRLELIDIDDLTVEQTFVDRMLGIGTLVIRSSDTSDPILPLLGIDGVQNVAEILDQARRKKRAKAMKVEHI